MRADRLLAEVMILQRRGRVTAAALASELEVSERTIHRDVYALRVAGVPVVTERGVGGGISLLGRWRTDLSGLTGRELASLAMLAAVNPVGRIDESARTALAKLGSLLPDHLLPDDSLVHVDIAPDTAEAGEAHLVGLLAAAIRNQRAVRLTLLRAFDIEVTRDASPLGLVFSGRAWHLVWSEDDDRLHVDALAAIRAVEEGAAAAPRRQGFDLERFWASRRASRRSGWYTVRALVDEPALPLLRAHVAGRGEGSEVELGFDSFEEARATMLSLGGAAEVLSPEALRRSVADFAGQVRSRYCG